MLNMGKKIVKLRIPILIISFLLLIPSGIVYLNTRINYDILSYLPGNIDTMKGQEILLDEFGTGAFSLCVVEGMGDKEVVELKKNIENVEHVKNVIWYDTLADISLPMEVLPEDIVNAFNNKEKESTLLMVLFDTSSSADETLEAIEEIRSMTKKQCLLGGMSAIITDMKKISNSEALMYVVIAAVLTAIVLALTMDSFLIPVFFLLSIGMAIIYNLGSNFVAGEISSFTSLIGSGYYGRRGVETLTPARWAQGLYQLAFPAFIVLGAVGDVTAVWQVVDVFSGLLAAVNLPALLLLSPEALYLLRSWLEGQKKKTGNWEEST